MQAGGHGAAGCGCGRGSHLQGSAGETRQAAQEQRHLCNGTVIMGSKTGGALVGGMKPLHGAHLLPQAQALHQAGHDGYMGRWRDLPRVLFSEPMSR